MSNISSATGASIHTSRKRNQNRTKIQSKMPESENPLATDVIGAPPEVIFKSNAVSTMHASTTMESTVQDNEVEEEMCFICTEPMHVVALGMCNHRHCSTCSLRLRALYQNFSCAYCKVNSFYFSREKDIGRLIYQESLLPWLNTEITDHFQRRSYSRATPN